jgi:pimeloyl-ACP methyl ester carboxylesterase
LQDANHPNKLFKSEAGFRKARQLHEESESKIAISFETKDVETSAGKTYIRIIGPAAAEPVFLWHGLGVHGGTWFRQINELAQQYRLLVPDVIGSMGNSAPSRLDRRGPAYGHWAAELMLAVDVPQAHHVGISNGGWLILKLATADSRKIASATLISSAGFVAPHWKLLFRMLPGFLAHRGMKRARHFARVMSPPGHEPAESFVQMIDVLLNDFKYQREPKPISNQELGCLKAPTLLLMGEHEAAFHPKSVITRAKAQLPNLDRYEIVSGVGHGMIHEDFQGVNSRIKQFLKAHPLKLGDRA